MNQRRTICHMFNNPFTAWVALTGIIMVICFSGWWVKESGGGFFPDYVARSTMVRVLMSGIPNNSVGVSDPENLQLEIARDMDAQSRLLLRQVQSFPFKLAVNQVYVYKKQVINSGVRIYYLEAGPFGKDNYYIINARLLMRRQGLQWQVLSVGVDRIADRGYGRSSIRIQ